MVRGWVIQAARSICYNAYKLEPPSHLTKEEERTRHIKDEIAKLIGNKWTFVNGDLDGVSICLNMIITDSSFRREKIQPSVT